MTKVNRVRRPNHWGRSSRREVICSRYWWIRRKPSPRRAWNRPAPTCPAELTRPVIPKQADGFTCYRVLVGGLDVVRGVGEGRDAVEPEMGEQRLAGGGGAGEFLVVVVEVGFQRVDGFQSHRDPAGVDLRGAGRSGGEGCPPGPGCPVGISLSPSGCGPCRGRSGYRMTNDPRSTVYPIARTPRASAKSLSCAEKKVDRPVGEPTMMS